MHVIIPTKSTSKTLPRRFERKPSSYTGGGRSWPSKRFETDVCPPRLIRRSRVASRGPNPQVRPWALLLVAVGLPPMHKGSCDRDAQRFPSEGPIGTRRCLLRSWILDFGGAGTSSDTARLGVGLQHCWPLAIHRLNGASSSGKIPV